MSAADDQILMRRAIALAGRRFGQTRPNPAVGCVIARDGRILAQAATAPGGRPHAEEQALADAGGAAAGATAFVTLEPCGQRSNGAPSCGERLAAAGVRRVVIAAPNPDPQSAGRGPQRLREAGVLVEEGFLEAEAGPLYEGFVHRLATGRPLVIAADDAEGSEAAFQPAPGEDPDTALLRLGAEGYSRLWTPAGGALAADLAARGLLHRPR